MLKRLNYRKENNLTFVDLGSFPQTHVSDTTLINSLNTLTTTNAKGYYEYEGCEYCKVTATPYKTTYTYSDVTKVTSGTSWFKVEPIKWRVLYTNNNEYTLLSEYLLIAKKFDDYSNNYKRSEMRTYLTVEFYNKTFTTNEKSFIQSNTNVNNDKVWLLSQSEVCNTTYGFNSDASNYDSNRRAKPTDYALATGAYFDSINVVSGWWLRTPISCDFIGECSVSCSGCADYFFSHISNTTFCPRPALLIKINQENQ